MKNEIIIHIGMHKTGTTSIQAMMYENISLLHKHGIYYPNMDSNHSMMITSMFAKLPHTKNMLKKEGYVTEQQVSELKNQYKNALEKELKNPKIKKVIFSGEEISLLDKEELDDFSQWLAQFSKSTTIICCTRNPVDWYNSRIQQMLQARKKDITALCDFLCSDTKRTYMAIKTYVDHFGKDNIILYDFDKNKKQIYNKFLQSCDIDEKLVSKLLSKPIKLENESLSQEGSLVLSALNRLKPCNKNKTNDDVTAIRRISGKKYKLSKSAMTRVIEHNEQAIQWLATNFPDECASYKLWQQHLEGILQHEELFQDDAITSLATTLSDLINENHKLRNSLTLSARARMLTRLISCIKKNPFLKKIVRHIREKVRAIRS